MIAWWMRAMDELSGEVGGGWGRGTPRAQACLGIACSLVAADRKALEKGRWVRVIAFSCSLGRRLLL